MLHVYWHFTLSTLRNYPTTCNPDRAKKIGALKDRQGPYPESTSQLCCSSKNKFDHIVHGLTCPQSFSFCFRCCLFLVPFQVLVGAMRQQWEDSVCTVNLPCVMKVIPVGLKIQTSALQILCCVRGEL